MRCWASRSSSWAAFVGVEVGAGVGDHGDLLLVEQSGREHPPHKGVPGVQITGDADPFAAFMGRDPAGEPDLVGDHPLDVLGIVHAKIDLLGRDRLPERENGVGLPCGNGILLLFELRNPLRELHNDEAHGHALILPKKHIEQEFEAGPRPVDHASKGSEGSQQEWQVGYGCQADNNMR